MHLSNFSVLMSSQLSHLSLKLNFSLPLSLNIPFPSFLSTLLLLTPLPILLCLLLKFLIMVSFFIPTELNCQKSYGSNAVPTVVLKNPDSVLTLCLV